MRPSKLIDLRSTTGDFFSIGSHIIRHFQIYWPTLAQEIERINYEGWLAYHKITGERVSGPEPATFGELTYTHPDGTERMIKFHRQNRPKFVRALLSQLKSIGVDITYGSRVVDYCESGEKQKASVVLENGSTLEADVVIAADGVGTKSNKLVSGTNIRAYPSGFSIFRTAFPVELATKDPDIDHRWPLIDGWRPVIELWQG
jgi:glycine/D-amino acid oxidase-like deaminating enzyme